VTEAAGGFATVDCFEFPADDSAGPPP
jgi:hypothetical protein